MIQLRRYLHPLYPDISLGQFDEAITGSSSTPIRRCPIRRLQHATATSVELPTAWAEVVRIAPDFSIERQRRILPFRNPDDFERRVEGLRTAGLTV